MKRSYQKKQRAEGQDQTRQKIVDATIALHQSKGIAATSVSDIAELAEVSKVTVYRHFPDEGALVSACSGQYFQQNPFPDPESWLHISVPIERLRHGLRETYAYHRATELMMARVLAEARDLPIMTPYHAHWQRAAEVLAIGWPGSNRSWALLTPALALAVSFDAWHFLVRSHQLSDEQVIEMMTRLTCDCELKVD